MREPRVRNWMTQAAKEGRYEEIPELFREELKEKFGAPSLERKPIDIRSLRKPIIEKSDEEE